MLKMVGEINGRLLAGIETGRPTRVQVKCQTCHRGLTVPAPIEDVVAHRIGSEGIDSATKEYRDLREKYYGSGSYDFSEGPLNDLAERLTGQKKLDEALAVAALNAELHPRDAWTRLMLAGVHKARGEKDLAIAAYEKALEINPGNAWAKKQLEALKGGAEAK